MANRSARQLLEILIEGKDMSGPAFTKVNKNAEDLEKNLNKVSGVMIGMGAAIATGLGAAVFQAAELETQVADALTLVDATGAEYAKMSGDMSSLAIELSRDLGISAEKIATGFYQVLSAGAQALTPEFEKLTRTALIMGELVGLETSMSVELLSDTVNAFKLQMADAGRVADVFFTASKLTATTVPQIAAAFTEAGPAAAAMGISIEETATVLDAFAAAGTKAQKAGTAFRIILTRLSAGTDDTKAALRDLGVTVFDQQGNFRPILDIIREMSKGYKTLSQQQKAATLKAIAGEEAFSKLAGVLEGNVETLDEWHRQLKDGGSLTETYEKRQETLGGQLKLLKEELKAVVFEIGQELLPVIKESVRGLRENAKGAGEWVTENKHLIGGVGALSLSLIGAGGLIQAMLKVRALLISIRAVGVATLAKGGLIGLSIAGAVLAASFLWKRLQNINDELDEMATKDIDFDVEDKHLYRKLDGMEKRFEGLRDRFGDKTLVNVEVLGLESVEVGTALEAIRFKMRGLRGEIKDVDALVADVTPAMVRAMLEQEAAVQRVVNAEENNFRAIIAIESLIENMDVAPRLREEFVGPLTEAQQAFKDYADAIKVFEEDRRQAEEERRERERNKPAEDPLDLFDPTDAIRDFDSVESEMGSMLRGMGGALLQFTTAGDNAFRQMALNFIGYIAQMTAQFLAFIALKALLSFFGLPIPVGASGGGVVEGMGPTIPVNLAQHGGIIKAGIPGVDNVPILAQQGEAFLDTELTDELRERLKGGRGAGGITVNINATALTATDSEAVRFGRKTATETSRYTSRFIARGTF